MVNCRQRAAVAIDDWRWSDQVSPEDVRHHFADYPFGDPCTKQELDRAESLLGQPIPAVLRRLYLSFNGFRGPTDAAFFWPLFAQTPGCGALVEMNLLLREEPFPESLTSKCLFYGDGGTGPQWGLNTDLPGKIILWDAEWGEDFEVVGDDMLEAWLARKRDYDELT